MLRQCRGQRRQVSLDDRVERGLLRIVAAVTVARCGLWDSRCAWPNPVRAGCDTHAGIVWQRSPRRQRQNDVAFVRHVSGAR